MGYLFGVLCVCALGTMPLVGCSETAGDGGGGACADWGQPFTSTISRSGDTLTNTSLVNAQMVSDEVTPCQAGETQVPVLPAK